VIREDIIRMGQEAGFRIGGGRDGPDDVLGTGYNLERFAALVAAAEREACAKVAEAQIEEWVDDRPRYAASECAAAIRARGEE
jgi:hypothetical protein